MSKMSDLRKSVNWLHGLSKGSCDMNGVLVEAVETLSFAIEELQDKVKELEAKLAATEAAEVSDGAL